MSFSDPEMDGVHRDAPEGQDLTDRGVLIFADVQVYAGMERFSEMGNARAACMSYIGRIAKI